MGTDEIGNTHFWCLPGGATRLAVPSNSQVSGEIAVPDGTAQMFSFERFSPRTTKLDPEMAIERTDEYVEVVATVDVCAPNILPRPQSAVKRQVIEPVERCILPNSLLPAVACEYQSQAGRLSCKDGCAPGPGPSRRSSCGNWSVLVPPGLLPARNSQRGQTEFLNLN